MMPANAQATARFVLVTVIGIEPRFLDDFSGDPEGNQESQGDQCAVCGRKKSSIRDDFDSWLMSIRSKAAKPWHTPTA